MPDCGIVLFNELKIFSMRKMIRTLVFGVVIAAPLLLVPHQSKAGIIGDILSALFGKDKDKDKDKNKNKSSTPTNSVPLNEGQILLIIAGLGLGAKMIYDQRKSSEKSVI
jgi:hypothetical protein